MTILTLCVSVFDLFYSLYSKYYASEPQWVNRPFEIMKICHCTLRCQRSSTFSDILYSDILHLYVIKFCSGFHVYTFNTVVIAEKRP